MGVQKWFPTSLPTFISRFRFRFRFRFSLFPFAFAFFLCFCLPLGGHGA